MDLLALEKRPRGRTRNDTRTAKQNMSSVARANVSAGELQNDADLVIAPAIVLNGFPGPPATAAVRCDEEEAESEIGIERPHTRRGRNWHSQLPGRLEPGSGAPPVVRVDAGDAGQIPDSGKRHGGTFRTSYT